MFPAPLNYDKYFNKVFSNEKIAKKFPEDFLEADIKAKITTGKSAGGSVGCFTPELLIKCPGNV
jgi:hypothetical protein